MKFQFIETDISVVSTAHELYIQIYISSSISKKESKLTFDNVPTMSWIQSTETSAEPRGGE